jgi:hypothetical protein
MPQFSARAPAGRKAALAFMKNTKTPQNAVDDVLF